MSSQDFPQPAFSNGSYAGFKNGSTWTINTGMLAAADKWYYVTVSIAKGSGLALRTANKTIAIRPRAAAVPTGVWPASAAHFCMMPL